jgi:hypothetical protein
MNLPTVLTTAGALRCHSLRLHRGADLLLSIDRAIAVSGRGQLLTFK